MTAGMRKKVLEALEDGPGTVAELAVELEVDNAKVVGDHVLALSKARKVVKVGEFYNRRWNVFSAIWATRKQAEALGFCVKVS